MPFFKKRWWKEYFSFTKKERKGIIILVVVIIVVFTLPLFFSKPAPPDPASAKELNEAIAKLEIKKDSFKNKYENSGYQHYDNNSGNTSSAPYTLFYFDPNTASAQDWERLGLREKTIHTILNYVSKGGKFRKPDDLLKIYGLREDDARRLIPYVRIESAGVQKSEANNYEKTGFTFEKKESFSMVEVNSADTTALKALPGIGSKLAQRIINFRNRLGGFFRVQQIGETYGLPDSTYQKISKYITINKNGIKQINLNTASANDLKQHPYIKWNLANVIVQYRSQHGEFHSIDDLKKINILTDEEFEKIEPYLNLK